MYLIKFSNIWQNVEMGMGSSINIRNCEHTTQYNIYGEHAMRRKGYFILKRKWRSCLIQGKSLDLSFFMHQNGEWHKADVLGDFAVLKYFSLYWASKTFVLNQDVSNYHQTVRSFTRGLTYHQTTTVYIISLWGTILDVYCRHHFFNLSRKYVEFAVTMGA